MNTTQLKIVKTLPWGEEVYLELPLHKGKSRNKFYARHGKNSDGKPYIEFTKFGPKPNTEDETYVQKLRLYSPVQWATLKHYVERELSQAAGWDLTAAQKDFEASQAKEAQVSPKTPEKAAA